MSSKQVFNRCVSYYLRFRHYSLLLTYRERKEGCDKPVFSLFSSGMISDEERDEVRGSLYAEQIKSIRAFVQDRYYIPRLIICAVIFLVFYLFFSLVIRDPLPLIDEIILSAAAAFICYVLLSRTDEKLAIYRNLASASHDSLSLMKEEYSGECASLEAYYDSLSSSCDIPSMIDSLVSRSEDYPHLQLSLSDELRNAFISYADENRIYRSYMKHLRNVRTNGDLRLSSLMRQAAANDNLDVYLLCILMQIM